MTSFFLAQRVVLSNPQRATKSNIYIQVILYYPYGRSENHQRG